MVACDGRGVTLSSPQQNRFCDGTKYEILRRFSGTIFWFGPYQKQQYVDYNNINLTKYWYILMYIYISLAARFLL